MPTKKIEFTVELDNQGVQSIEWEATDSGIDGKQKCASMMIHLWDKEARNTMNMHLWTKDMLVQDMQAHYLQNFFNMADSFQRSSEDKELSGMIRQFAEEFAKKLNQSQSKKP